MTPHPAAPARATLRAALPYGPCALVTGASEGIGLAMAQELARQGYDLVLVARRRERLEALAAELRTAHGGTVIVLPADLGSARDIEQVLRETQGLDIGLFVAAAGFGSAGPFVDLPLGNELDMVDVNCRAVVAMTHPIAQRLVARKRGGIVLFSSIVAFQGVAKFATYAATKAFVQSFAEGLRLELAPLGVDVLAVAPGPVATGFASRSGMVMPRAEKPDVVAREALAQLGRASTARPGFLAKTMEFGLSMLPRRGRVRMISMAMDGMANRKDAKG